MIATAATQTLLIATSAWALPKAIRIAITAAREAMR